MKPHTAWLRVLTIACLAAAFPAVVGAQPASSVTVVPAVYSSDPTTRNADLTLAGAVLSVGAVDKAIAAAWAPRPGGAASRLTRLSKLVLFDVPVVNFFMGLNHEGGHIARVREGHFAYDFEIIGLPWSGQPFELLALDAGVFDDLGSQAGGFEGSRRLKDRGESFIWRSDRLASGHALMTVLASLDMPVYAWYSLSGGRVDAPGDPARVLEILADRGSGSGPVPRESLRGSMRAKASLNLLDAALWSAGYSLARDYLWNGEAGVRVRWLDAGPVDLLPGLRYEWTPAGAEYSVRSHYRTTPVAGLGYVRWTERMAGARQLGAGGSVTWREHRAVTPRVDLDAWSHSRDGAGVHGAMTLEVSRGVLGGSSLLLGAGAKSSGHLGSFPLEAGAYFSAGVLFRPW